MLPLLALSLQEAAPRAEEAESLPLLTNPTWETYPRIDAYPGFAAYLGLKGQVTLECQLELTGHLSDCEVVSALPAQLGFEKAALDQVHTARLVPGTDANGPATSRVKFTFRFAQQLGFPGEPWHGPAPNERQLAAGEQMTSYSLAKEGPNPFLPQPNLADVDPAIMAKVISVIEAPETQAEFAALKVETRAVIAQAWARVLAKNGLQETPWEDFNLGDFSTDLFNAYNDIGRKNYQANPKPFRLKDRFCAVHDCGPQD